MTCRHPDCQKQAGMTTYRDVGIIRHSIEHCPEHSEWADKYLSDHLTTEHEQPAPAPEPNPEIPEPDLNIDYHKDKVSKILALRGITTEDYNKTIHLSKFNGPHMQYTGSPGSDWVVEVVGHTLDIVCRSVMIDRPDAFPITIGDGIQRTIARGDIDHQGNHQEGYGVFDPDILLNVPGVTRYNWDLFGNRTLKIVKIWEDKEHTKLIDYLIDWETAYLFIKRMWKVSSKTEWKCWVHPLIRNYILKNVKEEYGREEYKLMYQIIHGWENHPIHFHISMGKPRHMEFETVLGD